MKDLYLMAAKELSEYIDQQEQIIQSSENVHKKMIAQLNREKALWRYYTVSK